MSYTKYIQKTSSMPGYGIIFPSGYVEGTKLPVEVFLHGIGEISTKKTLQQCVDFHFWFKTAADKKKMIYILPQDDGTSLFDDKELIQLMPTIQKYSNGQVTLSGLSRGAGTCLSVAGTDSAINPIITGMIVICPPSWEGMNEAKIAAKLYPIWWFHGAKDAADPGTYITRAINTVDDIRRAGRTKNFYFSVYPSGTHYIWNQVMNSIGVPPITPANGANSWSGKNTVNGTEVSITVPCVNNPAVDVYDFMLLQKLGNYKPLPLLTDVVEPPAPSPTPTTGADLLSVDSTPDGVNKATFSSGDPEYFKPKTGDAVSLITTDFKNKTVTVRTKGGDKHVFAAK